MLGALVAVAVAGLGCASPAPLSLPEDWPSDVVPYPDARIVSFSHDEKGSAFIQETSDSTSDVLQFFSGTLRAAGWSVKRADTSPSGETSFASDDKKTGRAILVVLSPLESGTRIDLMMSAHGRSSPGAKRGKRRVR